MHEASAPVPAIPQVLSRPIPSRMCAAGRAVSYYHGRDAQLVLSKTWFHVECQRRSWSSVASLCPTSLCSTPSPTCQLNPAPCSTALRFTCYRDRPHASRKANPDRRQRGVARHHERAPTRVCVRSFLTCSRSIVRAWERQRGGRLPAHPTNSGSMASARAASPPPPATQKSA